MQQTKDKKVLSLIDTLTRNLFLFTVMCVLIALGITIRFLDIESLDTYWLQIKSSRLEFLFFIGVAACYIPLLFILVERYWVNFFTQLCCSIILFTLLLFVFAPPLKIKSYFFNYDTEFSIRSWEEMDGLYVGRLVNFTRVSRKNKSSLDEMLCPINYNYYFLSFIFTYYPDITVEEYSKDNKKLEKYCHKEELLDTNAMSPLAKIVH